MAFSRLWLSSLMWAFHTFLSSSSTFFLFHRLGVNFLSHAHPLHECSKYRKGVDQFDLYLASGLGTSQDKNPKETKCDTLVDRGSQEPFFSFFPSPLLARKHHLETFESRTARALAPYVLLLLVSMLIWLLLVKTWIELHSLIALPKSPYMVVCGMSPQKLCLLSFTYSRTSRN